MLRMLRRAWRELELLVSRPINRFTAAALSTYTMLWGFWLSNPFWRVFNQAPVYHWMADVASEMVWGLGAMSVGAVMLYGVVKASKRSLTIGAFVGFIHWLVVAVGYFAGNWQNTGGITSLFMATYCGVIYLNLRVVNHNLAFGKDSDTIHLNLRVSK